MQAPEARANIFRILFEKAYYVIIFKFQGAASAPACTPMPAPMLKAEFNLPPALLPAWLRYRR